MIYTLPITDHHLKFWGSIDNDAFGNEQFGTARDLWFDTPQERVEFANHVEEVATKAGRIAMFSGHDGPASRVRTVAYVTLELDGEKHTSVTDFGFGYLEQSAKHMYSEGSYSCDCNRSVKCGLPEMPCGNRFKLIGIRFEHPATLPVAHSP